MKNSKKEKIAKARQKGLPAVLSGQAGFVMILVIIMIALIGIVMFVLTEDAKTIMFQSDTAYLEAVERNLVASGLAWAKENIKDENKEVFDKTVKLDVTYLNIRNATLSVFIGTAKNDEVELELSTLCSRGRRTFRHHDKYKIRISHKSHSSKM